MEVRGESGKCRAWKVQRACSNIHTWCGGGQLWFTLRLPLFWSSVPTSLSFTSSTSVWRDLDVYHYIHYEIHSATCVRAHPTHLGPGARALRCTSSNELHVFMPGGGLPVSPTGSTPTCYWIQFTLLNIRMRVSYFRGDSSLFAILFLTSVDWFSYHTRGEPRLFERRCSYYKVRGVTSIAVWSDSDILRC